MPRLPVHESQATRAGQSGAKRIDSRLVGQEGRASQRVGAQVSNLAANLQKMEDTWERAHVTSQYTTARNERKSALNDILSKAQLEPDYKNSEGYYQALEDLRSQDVEIDNDDVKAAYDSETKLDADISTTKLDAMFKGKLVQHTRGEVLKDKVATESSYNSSASEALRFQIRDGYLERLKFNKDAGFISNAEYVSELEDMKEWEFNRAMTAAGHSPQFVIDNIDQFEFSSDKEKHKVIDVSRTNIARQDKVFRIATLERQNTNEANVSDMIFKDKVMSGPEKTILINEMELRGEISKGYASSANKYLNSLKSIDETTRSPDFSRILRMMNDANSRYDRSKAGKDSMSGEVYLRKIGAIQTAIVKTSGISSDDREKLQNHLNNLTTKKQSDATVSLVGDKYKVADTIFKNSLPSHLQDEALREYFIETDGKDLNPRDAKIMAQQIGAIVMGENRNILQDAFDTARQKHPKGDLRTVRTKSGGQVIVLYKNGKRVEVVGEVGERGR